MNKKICFIVLILFLLSISIFTAYIVFHPGIHVEEPLSVKNKNERISEIITTDEISMLYKFYLSDKRHKIKIIYKKEKIENNINIVGEFYFDGNSILRYVFFENVKENDIKKLWENEETRKTLQKNIDEFFILSDGKNDFAFFSFGDSYYVLNQNGVLINKEKINIVSSSKKYVEHESEKEISYENGMYFKLENNKCTYFVEVINEEKINLEEYELEIKKGKIVFKKLKTYFDVELKN